MVIIQVVGGLGNQLQQYALYREFRKIGTEVKLDLSWFKYKSIQKTAKTEALTERRLELACLNGLKFEVCTEEEKRELIGEEGFFGKVKRKLKPSSVHRFQESKLYHPEIFALKESYITGYFACERYYEDILEDLRREIRFPVSSNPLNQKMAEEMRSCQSVSVHIRRGDYLNAENANLFGGICTEEFYMAAIRMIEKEVTDAHFYIFSDDIPYVQEKYTDEKFTVVDNNHGEDNFYDMWLMSQCRHNICANSTFSFWGARLNDYHEKIMIRPTIHKNSQVFVKEEMEELWRGWRFIDKEGAVQ